ncbi:hypothetical protein NHX12_010969 [Muraenolepis orangiensis]|uniref:Ig-like domain-containing protein n=1 Tax=Muraenolepis orangiensis TaxID=630683 RepID=A0A9Q0DGT4_9TELE|nr:hypothetical protein NHX12_010969 [Muraenolepis orangiensis]
MPLSLDCKALLGYSGESRRPIIYWTRGERFVEELAGHIKESEVSLLKEYLGEKEVQLSLTFDAVEEADLGNYSCHVENHIGKRNMYRLELAGGLGVILLLLGVLTAVYKWYNLEMLLCYRSDFDKLGGQDDDEAPALLHAAGQVLHVLSIIKWRGPKSNELSSKFWKQVVYEMPAKCREMLSRRQVMDSGEQDLFGDQQTSVSTIAMTTTSSLAPHSDNCHGHHPVALATEIPDYNQMTLPLAGGHMRHFCHSYDSPPWAPGGATSATSP